MPMSSSTWHEYMWWFAFIRHVKCNLTKLLKYYSKYLCKLLTDTIIYNSEPVFGFVKYHLTWLFTVVPDSWGKLLSGSDILGYLTMRVFVIEVAYVLKI